MSRVSNERAEAFAGKRLLLVGNPDVVHIGAHLKRAARELGLRTVFSNVTEAYVGPKWLVRMNWWLRGRRPTRLKEFSAEVVQACRDFQPSWMLGTGIAPIEAWALENIGKLRVQRLNYLTDDPWNPAHKAPWFMEALPLYDHVFSLRRSNIEDLRKARCPRVSYLPFGYAPELHFPEPPASSEERERFSADVVFAGGADPDRVSYIAALTEAGFDVALYGGYWERYPETRSHSRGYADPRTLRLAVSGAKVGLCLVRRANRDGNSMRTFEVPAIGACMLTEDTDEHREIFGKDGEAVVYFQSIGEMLEKFKWLLVNENERKRLAKTAHSLIVNGSNSYKDRLMTMLGLKDSGVGSLGSKAEGQIGLWD